jgi:hypothetical protein
MHEYVQKSRTTTLPRSARSVSGSRVEPELDSLEVGSRPVVVEHLLRDAVLPSHEALDLRLRGGALLERLQRPRVLRHARLELLVHAEDHQDDDADHDRSEGLPDGRKAPADCAQLEAVPRRDRDAQEDEARPQPVGQRDEDGLDREALRRRQRRHRADDRPRAGGEEDSEAEPEEQAAADVSRRPTAERVERPPQQVAEAWPDE